MSSRRRGAPWCGHLFTTVAKTGMRLLKVIHGYPMRYNAGSEVYSQTLCHALARDHEVHVFTREEDPLREDFSMRVERDPEDQAVTVHLVNNPRYRDRYRAEGIDTRFAGLLDDIRPDVVHVGHLNHLSTSLVDVAAARRIPVVMTLHDYWLMCPRGQFMQMFPEPGKELWAACDGQDDRKCATRCYARYFSGAPEEAEGDEAHWTDWVRRRMLHVRQMCERIDCFIAPARYLADRFEKEFGLPKAKIRCLDYGFDLTRFQGRSRCNGEPFTFGYIGTHTAAKGIHLLLQAFAQLEGSSRLRVWGRERGQETESLKNLARSFGDLLHERIEWLPEYRNQDIVKEVFNRIDVLVVPSIWVENSPLVIHEAQQARVPVITANVGGMAEYVRHEENGLLFEFRNAASLAEQMRRFVADPVWASRLGERGYLGALDGNVPGIDDHVREVESIYTEALRRRDSSTVDHRSGPWRITFDTNPDTCNIHCIMCEEHSPHSPLQRTRKEAGKPPRVMPFELIERIIAEAALHGLKEVIPSTMGEPLLYDQFEGIVELCRRHGVRLNLTTNGTFPRFGARRWAELVCPVGSDVKVSWNGATKETHEAVMIGARWEQVLENVKTFVSVRDQIAAGGENRCRVTFQVTFLEGNVDELADIIRLAVALGVDRVKGHHLWAHFEQIKDQSMRRTPDSIRRWNKAVEAAVAASRERPLPNGQFVLLENIHPLYDGAVVDLAPGGPCPFLGQEAWISALGRFDPCCAPDAQRRQLGEFGDLNCDSLLAVWNSPQYRELLASYRNRSLCVGCNMRKPASTGAGK